MLLSLIVYTVVFFFAAQALPGVKLGKGIGPAAGLGLVFGVLNLFLGWLIKGMLAVFTGVLTILTLGLGFPLFALVGTAGNAVLLKIADAMLPGFTLEGWAPAFVLGFLLSVAVFLTGTFGVS